MADFVSATRLGKAIDDGGRLVLYSTKRMPTNLRDGDITLNMKWGSTPKANERVTKAAMAKGRPIGDTYVDDAGELIEANPGTVLAKERQMLRDAGWNFNKVTGN